MSEDTEIVPMDELVERVISEIPPPPNVPRESQPPKKDKSWIAKLIGVLSLLVFGSFLAFFIRRSLNKAAKEVAELRTKVELAELEKEREEHAAQIAIHNSEAVQAQDRAAAIQREIDSYQQEISAKDSAIDQHTERVRNADSFSELLAIYRDSRGLFSSKGAGPSSED